MGQAAGSAIDPPRQVGRRGSGRPESGQLGCQPVVVPSLPVGLVDGEDHAEGTSGTERGCSPYGQPSDGIDQLADRGELESP